jgi:hypothetical protein
MSRANNAARIMPNTKASDIHDVDILAQLKKFKLGELSINVEKKKSLLRDFKADIQPVKEFLAGSNPFVCDPQKCGELLEMIEGSIAFADAAVVEKNRLHADTATNLLFKAVSVSSSLLLATHSSSRRLRIEERTAVDKLRDYKSLYDMAFSAAIVKKNQEISGAFVNHSLKPHDVSRLFGVGGRIPDDASQATCIRCAHVGCVDEPFDNLPRIQDLNQRMSEYLILSDQIEEAKRKGIPFVDADGKSWMGKPNVPAMTDPFYQICHCHQFAWFQLLVMVLAPSALPHLKNILNRKR